MTRLRFVPPLLLLVSALACSGSGAAGPHNQQGAFTLAVQATASYSCTATVTGPFSWTATANPGTIREDTLMFAEGRYRFAWTLTSGSVTVTSQPTDSIDVPGSATFLCS